MKPGWNPTRRNRNLGTAASGYGQRNRLTIPQPRNDPRRFYERIGAHQTVTHQLGTQAVQFVIEEPQAGWIHACTPAETCQVLECCGAEHLGLAPMIVLRQPTRKQRILSPVWGRAVWCFEFGSYIGAAIILEAQDCLPYVWTHGRRPEDDRELERLRHDGHSVRIEGKRVLFEPTAQSIKHTILHRTLPHELGHHVDRASLTAAQWDAKPWLEREDFAHRYAMDVRERFLASKVAISNVERDEQLARDCLPLRWFEWREDVAKAISARG